MERISSRLTFVWKFIFLPVWIVGFGIGALGLWLDMGQGNGHLPSVEKKREILVAWIGGVTFLLWSCAGLKKVRMDSTHLYISNFRTEISVPLIDIVDITYHRWLNLPAVIHFRTPTVFGPSIKFLPPEVFIPFHWWGAIPPAVENLMERVGLKD